MKSNRAPFAAARSEDALYVRIHGLGCMTNAPTLEAFAQQELDSGAQHLVFDFADCAGVDSTFMGLLLSLSNELRERDGGLVLINVDEHAKKQLSSVGVDAFVTLKDGRTPLPTELRLTAVPAAHVSDRERLKLMVKAHKELVAGDARNKAKFGAFLEAIVAELG